MTDRPKLTPESLSKSVVDETTSPMGKKIQTVKAFVMIIILIFQRSVSSIVDPNRNPTNILSEDESIEQIAPNENILQLVAQIPNHPLQKFAQKLLVDRPKAISESHSKNASDDTTPPKTNSPTTSTS